MEQLFAGLTESEAMARFTVLMHVGFLGLLFGGALLLRLFVRDR